MIYLDTQYTVERDKKRILIHRSFKAPLAMVWNAWTDKTILDKWWAPKPWKAETKTMNFSVGGRWLYCMVGPQGERHWSGADYTKIEEQRCFHGTDFFCDESGNLLDGFPVMKWEVKFVEDGNHTTVEVVNAFEKLEDLEKIIEMGFKEGFAAAHDNLDELLKTKHMTNQKERFSITRKFNAPRTLVFKAFSESEALAKWWGPKGMPLTAVKLDFKPQGKFHYKMEGNGNTMWGLFVYQNILEPERIEFISSFSDEHANVCKAPFEIDFPLQVFNELILKEENGATVLTLSGFPLNATPEQEKTYYSMFESMNNGFKGTFEQLDDYLNNIKK